MNFKRFMPVAAVGRAQTAIIIIAFGIILGACSSGGEKPKPAELPPNVAVVPIAQVWNLQIGAVKFPLQIDVAGDSVAVASGDGTVVLIDARTGKESSRAKVDATVLAGAGSDGTLTAVVSKKNELIALQDGKELWRKPLEAETFTAPLVAGRRVFVLTADRALSAYDGQSGQRLWNQTRPADPLVLRRPGVLLAVGDTLVYGVSGRLAGADPNTGAARWEAPIAAPRGTNDIEKLVDLVGPANRMGEVVCARAYYASVGCVDIARGRILWTQPSVGASGLGGDDRFIYGADNDGRITAWRREDGQKNWSSELLKYRTLTAPLGAGRAVVIGDSTGLIHVLAREDGAPINRLATDGSPIAAAPVLVGNTVVVVTQKGGIYGFRPQ